MWVRKGGLDPLPPGFNPPTPAQTFPTYPAPFFSYFLCQKPPTPDPLTPGPRKGVWTPYHRGSTPLPPPKLFLPTPPHFFSYFLCQKPPTPDPLTPGPRPPPHTHTHTHTHTHKNTLTKRQLTKGHNKNQDIFISETIHIITKTSTPFIR